MYYAYIDGQKAYTGKTATFIKKLVDTELELGAFYAVIYRGRISYCDRRYDSPWKLTGATKSDRPE